MNGKQLKNSILQWAIQGKLVPQDPNDEPASVLLEKIRQEKERLIKEKKIKRDKNASIIYRGEDNSYYEKILATGEVKCIDEEIPFEIPQGWEWCRMSTLTTRFSTGPFGTMLHKEDYTDNGVAVINPTNIINHKISLNNIKQISLAKAKELQGYAVNKGDIILARRGDLRKSAIITDLEDSCIAGTGSFIIHLLGIVNSFFILFYGSPYVQDYLITDSVGTTMNNLNQKLLSRLLIPIPPRTEQVRIVSVVDGLFNLVNIYDRMKSELDLLNNSLRENIKKSILQEAIQGKIVPQEVEEGTAQELLEQIKTEKQKLVKEGKLKKSALNDSVIFRGDDNRYYEKIGEDTVCIDDEIPFDIPANWAWVRLDDICSFIHRGKSPKYSLIEKYPVVAQKCNQWSGFSIEKAKFIEPQSISSYKEEYILQDKDLMWNSTGLGTLGRMAIYNKKLNPYELAVADSHVTVIRPYKQYVVSEYLYYYFASNTVQSVIEDKSDGSTKQKELSTKTVKSYLVPLPPMEEQIRIVEKVEKLTQLLK